MRGTPLLITCATCTCSSRKAFKRTTTSTALRKQSQPLTIFSKKNCPWYDRWGQLLRGKTPFRRLQSHIEITWHTLSHRCYNNTKYNEVQKNAARLRVYCSVWANKSHTRESQPKAVWFLAVERYKRKNNSTQTCMHRPLHKSNKMHL